MALPFSLEFQMDREKILSAAAALTLGDRNEAYGSPYENLTDIAALFTTYLIGKFRGQTLDEIAFTLVAEDVAHLNILQKMARSYKGDSARADTYIDMAAYSAIAGECAFKEEEI